jgi:hypothetical protein
VVHAATTFGRRRYQSLGYPGITHHDWQFPPNGNMLLTFSGDGHIDEVDPSWSTVQTIKTGLGYAEWRETLCGPPSRK